jgi:glycerophosphoryl diester phosphodiesterase
LRLFLQARQDGADGIELDVRMTADKELVLVHDSTLNRTCGVNLRVKDATLEELQAADPEIPSLEQVFRTLSSGIHCNVELKSSPDTSLREIWELTDRAASLLKRFRHPEDAMISAFDPRIIDEMKRKAPAFRCGWLLRPSWIPGKRFSGQPRHFEALHPHLSMCGPRYLRAAKAANKAVNVWTVNTPLWSQMLEFLGADGIITDSPDRLTSPNRFANGQMLLPAYQ